MHQSLTIRMPGRYAIAALLGLNFGCGAPANKPAVAPEKAPGTVVAAPDGSYELAVPARWAGVYRIDSLSTQEQGTARPGALNLVYLPADPSVRPQTLVVVAVYDSTAWNAVRAEQGPPPGDSVAARFDSLGLQPAEVTSLVRIR